MNILSRLVHVNPKRAAIAAIVGAAIAAMLMRSNHDVLAKNIGLTMYESGIALVQVPYRAAGPQGSVSVAVDLDGNGSIGDSETVIRGFPAQPRKHWNSNYFFAVSAPLADRVLVRVLFDGDNKQTLERTVQVVRSADVGIREDLNSVTRPDESMKEGEGGGLQMAQRDAEVPDLSQRKAECAPTAAANSLISLAKEHGASDKLPADSLTMIDELKGDMRWTPADGVVPEDFVRGKNEWAAKKGLPIRTELAGDSQGIGTLEALFEGLKEGKAAELRIRFAESNGRGGYRIAGGHLITVVGVTKTDNGIFIDVNDPRTPDGTETYHVEGNQIEGYALWPDGPTLVGIGFTQTWTGQDLDPMTDAEVQGIREFAGEKRLIKALRIGDRYIPLDQVHVAGPDKCDANHWHANRGGTARDTTGRLVAEVYPECGYGKVTEVPVVDVELP